MQKPMVQIWSKATYKAEYSELGQTPTLRLKRDSQCPLHIQLYGNWELSTDEDSVRAAALEITLTQTDICSLPVLEHRCEPATLKIQSVTQSILTAATDDKYQRYKFQVVMLFS